MQFATASKMGIKLMSPTRQPYRSSIMPHRIRIVLLLCAAWAVFAFLRSSLVGSSGPRWQPPAKFPRKIWQSWKVDALRFETRDKERAISWTMKNPAWRYEVLTDDNAVTYVEEYYGPDGFNRPDIVATYKALNARIIQADLLRYLILYAEGGVWADIDVEALRSVDQFIPKRYGEDEIHMVIGVETDQPEFKKHPILGSKAESFCQWTFMTKPRLPAVLRLIDDILAGLEELQKKQQKPIGELELDFDLVLSLTGPSAFTVAIIEQMIKDTGKDVSWDDFHNLEESKVVGGVLVLPSEAFAAGTGHSDSGSHSGRAAMVKHHFHASSWTTYHPRYKHPIFAEVERCNWDPDCVKLWDANTAFFAALPEDEQLKMIAIKNLEGQQLSMAEAEDSEGVARKQQKLGPPAGQPPTDKAP